MGEMKSIDIVKNDKEVQQQKQSDKIEDLFDCYVMKRYEYSTPEIIEKFYWEEVKRLLYLTKNKCYLYGAIWTDRGLIYVAEYVNDEFKKITH